MCLIASASSTKWLSWIMRRRPPVVFAPMAPAPVVGQSVNPCWSHTVRHAPARRTGPRRCPVTATPAGRQQRRRLPPWPPARRHASRLPSDPVVRCPPELGLAAHRRSLARIVLRTARGGPVRQLRGRGWVALFCRAQRPRGPSYRSTRRWALYRKGRIRCCAAARLPGRVCCGAAQGPGPRRVYVRALFSPRRAVGGATSRFGRVADRYCTSHPAARRRSA